MPVNDVLTPQEATYIATNSYFALKDWINNAPVPGMESPANVQDRVLGSGTAGKVMPGTTNTSLKGTGLGDAKLTRVVAGTSGAGTSSGFGYLLKVKKGDRRHTVIATRGTRPEMGAPDLLTDARAAMTGFGDYGQVHKGFKATFDSVIGNLGRDNSAVMDSDVVHCVGHSLGGAVATLVAAHYARQGKKVMLYTFGSPRVGAFMSFSAMHKAIGRTTSIGSHTISIRFRWSVRFPTFTSIRRHRTQTTSPCRLPPAHCSVPIITTWNATSDRSRGAA